MKILRAGKILGFLVPLSIALLIIYMAIIFLFFFVISVSPIEFIARLNTSHPMGFSHHKFNQIKIGTPKEQVLGILGKPFTTYKLGPSSMCFSYSKTRLLPIPPLYFISMKICFDASGKVASKHQDIFAY